MHSHPRDFAPGASCLYHAPAHYTALIPAIVLDAENPAHVERWGRVAVLEACDSAASLNGVALWLLATKALRIERATPQELATGLPERITIVSPDSLRHQPKRISANRLSLATAA